MVLPAGTTLATRPAQFAADASAVDAGFVQRALGNFSNFLGYNSSQTLTASQSGSCIDYYGAGGHTFTLPAVSAMPTNGGAFCITNGGTGPLTVVRAGADWVVNGANSMTLNPGDSLSLVATNNSSQWIALGGSAQLGYSGAFGSSLSGNGYQKLPSGMLMQWGSVSSPGASGSITFPTAFLSGAYSLVAITSSTSAIASNLTIGATTATTFNFYQTANYAFNWAAVGK